MIAASLAPLAPADRIAALADAGSFVADPPVGASPDLARFGVVAREDDGIVTGRARIAGRDVLVAAQDERFLRGAAGPRHALALAALFARARGTPPRPVVLLLASGGVRLHEANAAELELARALKAAIDARAAGVPVVAIATGDVYGGASVLACACDRLALLPSTRLGLSGPAVVEIARGRGELDARDAEAVDAIYGAPARAAAGIADLVEDDVATLVAWIDMAIRAAEPFEARVRARHARILARLGSVPVASPPWIEPGPQGAFVLRAVGGAMGAVEAAGIDTALLAALDGGRMRSVLLVEDSRGHEVSRRRGAVGTLAGARQPCLRPRPAAFARARRHDASRGRAATAPRSSRTGCRRSASRRTRARGSSRWTRRRWRACSSSIPRGSPRCSRTIRCSASRCGTSPRWAASRDASPDDGRGVARR